LSSNVCFNKSKTKGIARENNILTPPYALTHSDDLTMSDLDWLSDDMCSEFGVPDDGGMKGWCVVVKPNQQGSSRGISIVENGTSLNDALINAFEYSIDEDLYDTLTAREIRKLYLESFTDKEIRKLYDDHKELLIFMNKRHQTPIEEIKSFSDWKNDTFQPALYPHVLIEAYIEGREITVSILGDKILPPIQINPKDGIMIDGTTMYDYKSKYTKGASDYTCPAEIKKSTLKKIKNTALKIHKLLGCKVYSRVDFRLDFNSNSWFLEINTLPGMTETSLFPMAAKATGLSFEDLIDKIIKLSLEK